MSLNLQNILRKYRVLRSTEAGCARTVSQSIKAFYWLIVKAEISVSDGPLTEVIFFILNFYIF